MTSKWFMTNLFDFCPMIIYANDMKPIFIDS